jgi:hypothetical protein
LIPLASQRVKDRVVVRADRVSDQWVRLATRFEGEEIAFGGDWQTDCDADRGRDDCSGIDERARALAQPLGSEMWTDLWTGSDGLS